MEKWRVRGRDRGSLIASIITEDAARDAPRRSGTTEHEGLTKLKPNAGGGGDEVDLTKLEPNAAKGKGKGGGGEGGGGEHRTPRVRAPEANSSQGER